MICARRPQVKPLSYGKSTSCVVSASRLCLNAPSVCAASEGVTGYACESVAVTAVLVSALPRSCWAMFRGIRGSFRAGCGSRRSSPTWAAVQRGLER